MGAKGGIGGTEVSRIVPVAQKVQKVRTNNQPKEKGRQRRKLALAARVETVNGCRQHK